jgi:hypothetical protein
MSIKGHRNYAEAWEHYAKQAGGDSLLIGNGKNG